MRTSAMGYDMEFDDVEDAVVESPQALQPEVNRLAFVPD